MANLKYIQITSFSSEDVNAMAEEIARISNTTLNDIKRAILKMDRENEGFVSRYELSVIDLLKVVDFYDFPIRFRIEYLESSSNSQTEESKKKYIDEINSVPDNDSSLLEKQLEGINDLDLKNSIGTIAKVDTGWQPPSKKIDPDDLPDFI